MPLVAVLLFLVGVVPARAELSAIVSQVIDGDTVELAGGERVRLIGIDAPEGKRRKGKQATPAQPFYFEAKRALTQLVENSRVKLVEGEDAMDAYGRTLAYISLTDGTDVQQALLRRGLAMVAVYPPNVRHLEKYAKTEAEARRARRGIWGHPYFAVKDINRDAILTGGFARIAGVVTSVSRRHNNLRITVNDRLTLVIYLGVWRKFWPGQNADDLIGRRIMARGRIASRYKTMRITHPFMMNTGA